MLNSILKLNPVFLSLLGGLFSFFMTALGSSIVLLFRKCNKFINDSMLSISSGIMFSASFFSLLSPALKTYKLLNQNFFLNIFLGFLFGGVFILLNNKIIDKINSYNFQNIKNSFLLFVSITLHNIPEGLAIGVAYGNLLYGGTISAAISLTFGISIQNFPEGAAISLPLKRDNISSKKAFLFGAISGLVEPIFAVIGALLVLRVKQFMSFILCFAAGAMIFVTIFDLIPESQKSEKKGLMALLFIIGFLIMMSLDVLL